MTRRTTIQTARPRFAAVEPLRAHVIGRRRSRRGGIPPAPLATRPAVRLRPGPTARARRRGRPHRVWRWLRPASAPRGDPAPVSASPQAPETLPRRPHRRVPEPARRTPRVPLRRPRRARARLARDARPAGRDPTAGRWLRPTPDGCSACPPRTLTGIRRSGSADDGTAPGCRSRSARPRSPVSRPRDRAPVAPPRPTAPMAHRPDRRLPAAVSPWSPAARPRGAA